MRLCIATVTFILLGASNTWAFVLQVPTITSNYQVNFAWTPQGEAATCSTVQLAFNCDNGGWNDLTPHGIAEEGFSQTFPPDSQFAQKLIRQGSLQCDLRAKCSSNPGVPLPSIVHFVVSFDNNKHPVISGSTHQQPSQTHQPPGGDQSVSSTEEPRPSRTQTEPPTTTSTSSNDAESSTSAFSSTRTPSHPSGSSTYSQQNDTTLTYSPTALGETPTTTPVAAATSSPEASSSGKSKPVGAIVGGVVGGLIGLLILVNLVLCLIKKRKIGAHPDGELPSPVAYDPRRKTMQRAWNDEMNFVMGQAGEKTRAVAAVPDGTTNAPFQDSNLTGSHPSYKALLENLDEQGYVANAAQARWKEADDAAYRRASFQSRSDDGSSIYHPEVERSDSPVMRWDPNRFVRSPSPHS